VTIESINYHLEQGKRWKPRSSTRFTDRGAGFRILLCICIVFIPMFF